MGGGGERDVQARVGRVEPCFLEVVRRHLLRDLLSESISVQLALDLLGFEMRKRGVGNGGREELTTGSYPSSISINSTKLLSFFVFSSVFLVASAAFSASLRTGAGLGAATPLGGTRGRPRVDGLAVELGPASGGRGAGEPEPAGPRREGSIMFVAMLVVVQSSDVRRVREVDGGGGKLAREAGWGWRGKAECQMQHKQQWVARSGQMRQPGRQLREETDSVWGLSAEAGRCSGDEAVKGRAIVVGRSRCSTTTLDTNFNDGTTGLSPTPLSHKATRRTLHDDEAAEQKAEVWKGKERYRTEADGRCPLLVERGEKFMTCV